MKLKLTCSAILIFFFLTASNLSSQHLHSEKLSLMKSSVVLNDSNKVTLHEKSPLLAGSLSFIVPGLALGQFYNEQYFKGILHIGISGLAVGMFFSAINIGGGSSDKTTIGYAGFLLYLSNWLYTVFDAMVSAENINKQIMLQKYRSDILNKFKLGLTVDKNKNLNLKFAFEL